MMSDASAAMKPIGEIDGRKVYWAEPGRFTVPGVYYWDGATNVHVPIPFPGELRDEEVEAIVRIHREALREPGDPPIEGPYGWTPEWKAKQIAAMRAALAGYRTRESKE
jgi:hypothetical protein